jgi:hypothetical protein
MNPITPPFVQLASYGPMWAVLSVFLAIGAIMGGGIILVAGTIGVLGWALK